MFLQHRQHFCMGIPTILLFSSLHITAPGSASTPAPLAAFLLPLLSTSHPMPGVHTSIPFALQYCPMVPVAVHDCVEAMGDSKDSAVSKRTPDCCLD